jgi:hypothetical protein
MRNQLTILRDRQPVVAGDMAEWALWVAEHDAETIVGDDTVGPYRISTRFLGDSQTLFETMVFAQTEEGERIKAQERCATWKEAEVQHRSLVAKFVEIAKGPE